MKIEYREPRISFIELGDETIKKIISYTEKASNTD